MANAQKKQFTWTVTYRKHCAQETQSTTVCIHMLGTGFYAKNTEWGIGEKAISPIGAIRRLVRSNVAEIVDAIPNIGEND